MNPLPSFTRAKPLGSASFNMIEKMALRAWSQNIDLWL